MTTEEQKKLLKTKLYNRNLNKGIDTVTFTYGQIHLGKV